MTRNSGKRSRFRFVFEGMTLIIVFRLTELLESCVSSTTRSSTLANPKDLDSRYFYFLREKGFCSSGFARRVGADLVMETAKKLKHSKWLSTVRDALKGGTLAPLLVEFYMEKFVISQLCGVSCHKLVAELISPLPTIALSTPVTMFNEPQTLNFDTSEKLDLVPYAFNHTAIDVIVAIKVNAARSDKLVHVYPIQITNADSHKDSEYDFLAFQEDWQQENKSLDLVWKFIWICKEGMRIDWKDSETGSQESEYLNINNYGGERRNGPDGTPLERHYCNISLFKPT